MDKLNSNTNEVIITNNSEGEQSSLSSSFILQTYSDDGQPKDKYKLQSPVCISKTYEEEFFDHFHINYYGDLEHEGLFLASIRCIPIKTNETSSLLSKKNSGEETQLCQALIRTMNNNYDVSEMININNGGNILQILFEKAQLSPIVHHEVVQHIKANEKLLEFDKLVDEQNTNKVSFIFQRLNQQTESEMLSNDGISTEMEDFLNLISTRIKLEGFNKHRGDLDIKTNHHGIYSYFTIFQNHQIMFNIAPMIPSDKTDQQFIHRKGLIGNAFISVIFQEEGSTFHPNFIIGKVTQVYITVQPMFMDSELYYKIEIWRRDDIEPILEPRSGIFKHEESFRGYFLTLLLNTMNIILKKESLRSRIVEPGQRLKNEFIKKMCGNFYSYSRSHNLDTHIINTNSNARRLSPSKLHHIGFISKILGAFRDNQPPSSSTSTVKDQPPLLLHNSIRRDSGKTPEIIPSLAPNIFNIFESTRRTSLTSSTNTNTNNQNGIDKDHTNISPDENQDTLITSAS